MVRLSKFAKVEYKGGSMVAVSFVESEQVSPELDFFYKHIDTDIVEFVTLDDVTIIVDEVGLLKTGNPVMEVVIGEHEPLQLAGTIVFGQTKFTDEGLEVVGFDTDAEAFKFTEDFGFSLLGFVK